MIGRLDHSQLRAEVARLVRIKRFSDVSGIIAFDCPFCTDKRGRGWISLERGTAGCWNAGCEANPRLSGGAEEWLRKMRGRAGIESGGILQQIESKKKTITIESIISASIEANKLWGLNDDTVNKYNLKLVKLVGYDDLCPWRLYIPILSRQFELLGYQLRLPSFYPDTTRRKPPKYVASSGCKTSKVLFGLHTLPDSASIHTIILLEGAGDVMRWWQDKMKRWKAYPLGLFGQSLSSDQIDIIASIKPKRIIVALDTDAKRKSMDIAGKLYSWLVPKFCETVLWGSWVGGKDAGSGAELLIHGDGRKTIESGLRVILGKG